MDDFKATGVSAILDLFIKHLRDAFDNDVKVEELSIEDEMMHTGIRHTMLKDGTINNDQNKYIACLKPIKIDGNDAGTSEEAKADEELSGLFTTLLGGTAWSMLTRMDANVYVAALQRKAKNVTILSIKRLNRLVSCR